MIICPQCRAQNRDGEIACVKCGTALIDLTKEQATRTLGDTDFEEGVPKWGSARFNGAVNLHLQVLETGDEFVFDAGTLTEIIIGRKNDETGDNPHVDLSALGLNKGVSRKHAVVVRRDGALHIIDYASANGTYLNGQRLVAQQPRILRDGDDIRLGHLVLRVSFKAQS